MIRHPATHDASAIGRLDAIPGRWATARGSAPALADARGEWTWRELEHGRRQLAELLLTLGVRAGDRVMVVGENCATLVAMLFAISSVGAWAVNVNARLSPREIDAIRSHAGARRVIYLGADSPDARQHSERDRATAISLGRWATIGVSALDERCLPEPVTGDPGRDVAALLYTSGTTGEPKAVMLTHANLMFIARVSGELRALTPEDRVYGVLPISHVYGLASVCLGSLRAGASLHLEARFTPAAMAQRLEASGITVCQGVPALYAKLLAHLKSRGRPFAAPALRFLYAGGSPLPPALKQEVEQFFGLTLHNGYGLTEASPTVTQTRHSEPRSDCSVGRPLPGVELRIVRDGGDEAAPGETGELWVRGPNIMKGYYRNAEATAEAMRPGRWLATGDIARQGADGAYFIEGRLKELIIHSGFNVNPVEVEAVLNAHPAVLHSAVVGRDTGDNEEVVAFVEPAPGAQVTAEALMEFAAASLAPYKRPAEIIFMDALPAASNGKVLKSRLAEVARERAAGTATNPAA